jgi:hypothetical protein
MSEEASQTRAPRGITDAEALQRDGHAQKASKVRAEMRGDRKRVCTGCLLPTDQALGRIHSELPCDRCGKAPCFGIVTIGDRDTRLDP